MPCDALVRHERVFVRREVDTGDSSAISSASERIKVKSVRGSIGARQGGGQARCATMMPCGPAADDRAAISVTDGTCARSPTAS
jgi:hypothetical protein